MCDLNKIQALNMVKLIKKRIFIEATPRSFLIIPLNPAIADMIAMIKNSTVVFVIA